MRERTNCKEKDDLRTPATAKRFASGRSGTVWALIAAVALGMTAYRLSSQTPAQAQATEANKQVSVPEAKQAPAANESVAMRDGQPKPETLSAGDTDRKRQITDDSARLLKLASDLKIEVDKTSKDTLSLSVIRKADEIEKLAHNVREKMRVVAGAN